MANGEWRSQSVLVRPRVFGEEEVEEEKWLMHYSSFHQILLVGDGDFSFALCLAKAFGSASNIVASSLDSYDALISKYKQQARSILENLEKLGASLLHKVDATKMKFHPDLRMRRFDRIIYNFPHAGFHGKEDESHPMLLMGSEFMQNARQDYCLSNLEVDKGNSGKMIVVKHRTLVYEFFRNAICLLRPNGEIHVSHKTTPPFSRWDINELASLNSLTLIECVDFRIEDFPGYSNKRGSGRRPDEPFPLGECSTFKFIVSPFNLKMSRVRNQNSACGRSLSSEVIPGHIQRQPPSFDWQPPSSCHVYHMNMAEYTEQSSSIIFTIFDEYLNHAKVTFGRVDYDVARYTHEALQLGYERYLAGDPGRASSGYVNILEELHRLSILRRKWLLNRLFSLDL